MGWCWLAVEYPINLYSTCMNTDETYRDLTARYDMVVEGFRELLDDTEIEREEFPARYLQMINSPVHGIDHWVRVCLYALDIGHYLWADGQVELELFISRNKFEQAIIRTVFFHDCARLTEGIEFDHGRWADKIWCHYAERKGFEKSYAEAISEALIYHVDNPAVVPGAGVLTVCLCNGDRLDRVRLGEQPDPKRMYEEGRWSVLNKVSDRLFEEYNLVRLKDFLLL